MSLLAEDLPADFDFETKVEVLADDWMGGMNDEKEYNVPVRELCGDGFRVLEAHLRRRKLMVEVGDIIVERTQDDLPRGPRM